MRRRRQCAATPAALSGSERWQCQRLVDHDGPHKASCSDRSTTHCSWKDGGIGAYHTLPGTVRFRPPFWTPERRYRAGGWAVSVLLALTLWWAWSLAAAVGFLVVELFASVRRSHFVDVGRFTAGVWRPATPTAPSLIFGVAFAMHGEGRTAKRAGLQVILGPVVVGVFSLMPRSEWPAYERSRAAFKARQKGPRS
ncbi:hypothetical protein [Streptomyces niveus]|uniref:hypothetical protein n=1 Tax=Streptomyces niveus TaxID=193462 RepID=UPI00342A52C1